MPELSSFEQRHGAEKPTLAEKLQEEYPELESRLTFSWPLSERRRMAIKMINSGTFEPKMALEFLESSDFVERKVGMFLIKECPATLKDFSEETYTKIQSILKRGNFEMGASAEARIKILVEFHGDKALPILEKIISVDKNPEEMVFRAAAIEAKIKILAETQGEKALPVLEKISEDETANWRLRVAAWEAKIKIITGTQGEKALPILEKMSESEDRLISKIAKAEIERLKQEQLSWSEHQKFLKSRKPLFATPYTKELAQRIIKISEVAKDLQNKFGDKFIGLTIFGSTAKGYFRPSSDLDYGIIAKNKKVSEYFKERAPSLHLCFEHYAEVSKESKLESEPDILFYGLFFGNRQKLLELQEKTLETIGEEEWNNVRHWIAADETNLTKATQRFDLKEKELEKIKQFALLLRVPPPHQEALNAIRSQRQKMSEFNK